MRTSILLLLVAQPLHDDNDLSPPARKVVMVAIPFHIIWLLLLTDHPSILLVPHHLSINITAEYEYIS